MKALPRYRFTETGVGCAEHDDPTCLCDVIVTTPAPILVGVGHKYHDMVMHELDDDAVSNRNINEFASILLGLAKLEGFMETMECWEPRHPTWQLIPRSVFDTLRLHAMVDSPRHVAAIELDGLGLSAADRTKVLNMYVHSACNFRKRENKRSRKASEPT